MAEKIKVKMLSSLQGEDKKDWLKGEIHEATELFAQYLINRDAARPAQSSDKSEAHSHGPPALTTKSFASADPTAETRDPAHKK